MTITPYGDSAILINFEQKIDAKINAKVVALSHAIISSLVKDVTYCTPAYCSVTVGFNPAQIQYNNLIQKINVLSLNLEQTAELSSERKFMIPVCYEGDFAFDKQEVLDQTNLSWTEVVELHTATEYRVYMLGFIAGFAYMGKLPSVLSCNRKKTPRLHIPPGTVGIAGLQTGIYPTKAHAGWQLIGRTPIPVFDIKSKNPFLFMAGDRVQFRAIKSETYEAIRANIKFGTFNIKSVAKLE